MSLFLSLGFGDHVTELTDAEVAELGAHSRQPARQPRHDLAPSLVSLGGPPPQKVSTMSLTATELKVVRLFGYAPEEFTKEKARLAALDARDAQIATLDEAPGARPATSSELSATDLKVIRLSGVSAEDFIKQRARLAALDARDNDLARMVEE